MSILLGIEQSLASRLARGRSLSPQERRRTGRPETGLTMDEGAGPWSTRDRRLGQSGVASRRDIAVAAMGIDLDVRSQHDLLARDGGAALGARPRVLG